MQQADINSLLNLLEKTAKEHEDGHYTIFRFTSGFKVVLGTPDTGDPEYRKKMFAFKTFESLDEAIAAAIVNYLASR